MAMKFLLTRELGRLAKWLRILGFDTIYLRETKPGAIFVHALKEERIIITRNRRLAGMPGMKILHLQTQNLKEQLQEIKNKLSLKTSEDTLFTRCVLCNHPLVPVAKEMVKDKVPEYVFLTQENFLTCPQCKRIFWSGTHRGKAKTLCEEIGI